ncbi:AraC family transcriptional regulator [Bradyrhizobium sp. S3.2.12]|uniref:AraC family transcriptional regulator n=1 Tax=Bradyrhizobium sp. S3.2.12 TaxID=3156387 RepID=UPI003395B5A4
MTSATADYRRDVAAGDPVTLFLNSSASEFVPHNGGVVDKAWILAFQGLRIVIASAETGSRRRTISRDMVSFGALDISSTDAGFRSYVAPQVELSDAGTAMKQVPDPMIGRLSDALDAAERACDQHSRIYADAVRLAIAIRLLGQSEARRCVHQNEPVEQASVARPVRALQKWRLKRVLEYIDDNLSNKIYLADLAAVAGLSHMHFASQFRVAIGLPPHEYLLKQRIRRAEELLVRTTTPIVEIALTVGFQSQAHFTTVFKRFMGHAPCRWRKAHHADELPAI